MYDNQGEIVHWTLEDTNPAGLNLLGKTSLEEVRGKNETELFGRDNREERLPLLKKLKATGEQIVSETSLRLVGTILHFIIGHAWTDDFINSVTDITEMVKETGRVGDEGERGPLSIPVRETITPMLVIESIDRGIVDVRPCRLIVLRLYVRRVNEDEHQRDQYPGPGEVKEEMAQSLTGDKRKFDFHHRLANGVVRDVEVHSGVIHVQGRPLLY